MPQTKGLLEEDAKTITSLKILHLWMKSSKKVDEKIQTIWTISNAAYVRPSMVNVMCSMVITMTFDSVGIARNRCVPIASGLKRAAPVNSKCAGNA